ncbi:MAG: hypothetical protein R2764_16450 [Bacteroidales bacterium]
MKSTLSCPTRWWILAPTLCLENDSLILDAGNGYTQYYWNNLVTEQTFTVHTYPEPIL